MRVTVFGAAGNVGSRIVAEAVSRGHDVTGVVRDPARIPTLHAGATTRVADASSAEEVTALSRGQDVVLGATRPKAGNGPELARTARALLTGVGEDDVRLLLVGGAASLVVPGTDGGTVSEQADYPASLREIARACNDQLAVCRAETRTDWAYLSPPAQLEPGRRTGRYRLGTDELLLDSEGRSWISMEDLAVVLLDEAEQPRHHRARFTAAY